MIASAEAFSTGRAREWFLASMCSLVPDEVVPPTEGFPTLVAPAGPHRGVSSQVLGKCGAMAEAPAALAAEMQLLGRVSLPVHQVPPVVAEVRATLPAQVGLASQVDSLVCRQHTFLAEAFATDSTEEGSFSCMCPLMPDEVRSPAEVLSAVVTSVGFLNRLSSLSLDQRGGLVQAPPVHRKFMSSAHFVNLLVPGKVGAPCVTFSTLHTLIGFLPRVSPQVPDKVGVTSEAFSTDRTVMMSP